MVSSALRVSAVICTRNRPDDLGRTLESLSWQSRPCDEVLVIDDSEPQRRSATEAAVSGTGLPLRVMTKDVPGLTASRNLAVEHVTGDVTLFVDDDVILHPGYVSALLGAFEADHELVGAGGSIDDDHDYELRWLRAALMIPGRRTGRVYPSGWSSPTPRGRSADVQHLIGCNMAFRTSVLRRYRFADDFQGYALGEDLELSHRLHLDGHRLVVVGDAHLWHLSRPPVHDRAWGYRETVIRPVVAGRRFRRAAFTASALAFAGVNAVRNPERARGNLRGIADVLRGRLPAPLHTMQKHERTDLRVAMIGSRGFPGQGGGVERVLEAVTPRLVADRRAQVRVYCASYVDYDGDDFHGVQLCRTPSLRSKHADTFTRSALATLRELRGGAEVIHYHSIGSAPLAIVPRLLGRRVVVTVHAQDWQRSKWNRLAKALLRFGEWAAVRFPNETVVVSRELQAELERRHGRPVTYIANGAERRTCAPADIIRRRWGLHPRSYVLFVGRLVPEKDVHVLIDAFRAVPVDHDLKLVIAGPTWYEEAYSERLQRLAGGDERVLFVGAVDEPPLQELYSNCHTFVLPSRVEGMSLALLDAMAFGCCIITSDIPENAGLVGDAGLTFRTGDHESLRDQLRRVLTEPDLADDLRERAASQAGREHDWDRIAAEWHDLYGRVARR